jgi:2-polyprenyl-6-methoxyphenol hydroxylase-like FAD-dependent oxidoreductase
MNQSDSESSDQTVIIIGGGIGGLAAAIALQDVGFDVEVYEQADELREVGAGLTIWRNGLEALDVLGGHEAAVRAGAVLEHSEIRSPGGSVLNEVHPRSVLSTESDVPPGIGLHRADLQRILRDRVGDGVVHLGHECVGVEEDDDQVTARFSSGKEVRGDVLIGADGIHSAVRASLHGETAPRFSGVGIWRAVIRIDHPLATGNTLTQALGSGQRFGALPIGDGRVYWIVTERVQQGLDRPTADSRQRLARDFADWHEPIPTLIEETPQEALIWDEVEDRELLDEWGRGRITLLGDAAHLALPFAAQGASQALEDAVWVARYLARQPDAAAALRAYEAHRQDRTEMVVRTGRRLGRMWNLSNPIAVAVRDVVLKYGPDRLMEGAFKRMVTTDL